MAQNYNTYDQYFEGPMGDPQSTTKYNWTGPNQHNLNPNQVDWSNMGAQSAAHKRNMIGDYMTSGQLPSAPGGPGSSTGISTGVGGAGGASGGGPAGGQFQTPEDISSHLAQYGAGLLDPGSELSQRWMEQLREDIGRQTDAAQRAAAYQAAQSGFGVGASPELLSMQRDIGVSGLEAAGEAANRFAMRAPEMGIGAMSGALGPEVSMRGQDLTSAQFDASQQAQQQQMQAQMQMAQRELDMQREYQDQQLALEQERLRQQAQQRGLASLYGGYGGGGSPLRGRSMTGYRPPGPSSPFGYR